MPIGGETGYMRFRIYSEQAEGLQYLTRRYFQLDPDSEPMDASKIVRQLIDAEVEHQRRIEELELEEVA